MANQRVDRWQERGGAEAILRLFVARRLRPITRESVLDAYFEACRLAEVPRRAAEDALHRARLPVPGKRRKPNMPPHPAPAGKKWCGYGAHFAPLDEFMRNRTRADGLQAWCTPCRTLYVARARARRNEATAA